MGLLDVFNSDEGRMALGLLAAAGPSSQPMSFGQRLAGAMSQHDAYLQHKQAAAAAAQDRALKQQMLQAQMADVRAQQQQREAQARQLQQAALRQQAFQGALAGGSRVGTGEAMAQGGGPTPQAAAQLGQPKAMDWNALAMQFPDQIDQIKKLAEANNFGRNKVARVEETMVDGRPVKQQFDDYGGIVGSALPQWKEPKEIDTGGQIGMLDPVTRKILTQFQKTNTPGELLSSETARRGQNLADARSRDKNKIDAGAVSKVDWKQGVNGEWVALPKEVSGSGPVTPVTTTMLGKREQSARNVLDIIAEAKPLLAKSTGSYTGAAVDEAARIFGNTTSGAVNVAKLKTLEGSLMMAMPRMEGPQSDKDVAMYQQAAGRVGDPTVPPALKLAALESIEKINKRYAPGYQAAGQPEAAGGSDLAALAAAELARRQKASANRTGSW